MSLGVGTIVGVLRCSSVSRLNVGGRSRIEACPGDADALRTGS